MKKVIMFVIALAGIWSVQAQDFQGIATYETKISIGDVRPPGGRELSPEERKQIDERMKKALEKTMVLRFDRAASLYTEDEKLEAPGAESGGMFRMMASFMGDSGKLYKNVKQKNFIAEREVFGKGFLITDTLSRINWKMENETKKIGNYTCYKATAVVAASRSDFRNLRMRRPDNEKPATQKEGEKSTNLMGDVEMPKTKTITAWYSPEIPVSQGPEHYWGLPGLILEVNDGRTAILCTKVVLNPKEKAEIKAPTSGEKVTQAKFDEIVTKKAEEMREMFMRNGGPGRMPRGN
jgi:GLPGLI family protein